MNPFYKVGNIYQTCYILDCFTKQPPWLWNFTEFLKAATMQSCQVWPIPAYYSLFQSIPAYLSLFQPNPANSSIFQHIPAYSSLFQPILAYSSLFFNIQFPIRIPESPNYNFKCPIVHFIPNWKFCLLVLY